MRLATILLTLLCVACAGTTDYRPPSISNVSNTKTVAKSKDQVWDELIPALAQRFFVINNLDKDSGLVNISYSGNPVTYIDCGWVTSEVTNLQGKRTYSFPGASAYEEYEIMNENGLWFFTRTMSLEGRMNIIVQQKDESTSMITANTKYVVTKSGTVRNVRVAQPYIAHTINFNTNEFGQFPGVATMCRPNGEFERDVLRLVE